MLESQMITSRTEVAAEQGLIVGGHRLEAEAGVRILQAGGNAIDALVASAFAGFVVEPASCGLGGYGRLSIYWAEKQEFITIDHYVRAPLKSHRAMFEIDQTKPWHYYGHPQTVGLKAEQGYLSPAVPGAVAGMCAAHEMFGRLPLAQVLEPAIEYAEAGVAVTWDMVLQIASLQPQLEAYPHTAAYLLKDGYIPRFDSRYHQGDRLDTSNQAKTLRLIAEKGPAGFYTGAVAAAIEREVTSHGGILSAADLAAYRPKILREKAARYRDYDYITAYDQVGYGTLNILNQFDLASYGPDSLEFRHLTAEALGHAFMDNKVHYGDPEHVKSPVNGLASAEFGKHRAQDIQVHQAASRPITAADPWPFDEAQTAPDKLPMTPTLAKIAGTTQMTTVDRDGNMTALITSLSNSFGAMIYVPEVGVMLNNSMQNYDPRPDHPNCIMPGKMPIFAAPSLVATQNGQATFAGCGSGGYRIMTGVLHSFMHAVDFDMNIQAAVDAPRIHCQGQETYVDARIDPEIQAKLAEMGHTVIADTDVPGTNNFGRICAIWVDPKTGIMYSGSNPAWGTAAAGF